MEKIYNKLVRDQIPDMITKNNGNLFIKVLDDTLYKSELEKNY